MSGKLIGEGTSTLVCVPLVGRNRELIMTELDTIIAKGPDVIEWRADFFEDIADFDKVIEIANLIKEKAYGLTVIFTIRSVREGGQPIPLSDREAIELNAVICQSTCIEYIDCELSNKPSDIEYLRQEARKAGKKVIASFHNFDNTPSREMLNKKIAEAEQYELDIAKIAVMPQTLEDVLTLLSVTSEAKNKIGIPIITMSMGGYGAITRMIGGLFGSSLTFAVGHSASAPGQVPIEDLRTVMRIVGNSMGQ